MSIAHISDTARWVAVYRAMESERPDAIFRDPCARRLAGERGETIVREMRRGAATAWAMIVRTAVFDEMILERVAAGADLVVNLAAGLDTRPWRLDLPAGLRWVDVDLPGVLEYKTEALRGERTACRYEAAAVDLTDVAARRDLFGRLAAPHQAALVVTEGLLVYLAPEQVTALATDLHAQPAFRWWLIDLASPRLLRIMNRYWGKSLQEAQAPFRFGPPDGTAFFRPAGWHERAFRASLVEARRLRREMRGMWIWRLLGHFVSARRREETRRMAAYVLLDRA